MMLLPKVVFASLENRASASHFVPAVVKSLCPRGNRKLVSGRPATPMACLLVTRLLSRPIFDIYRATPQAGPSRGPRIQGWVLAGDRPEAVRVSRMLSLLMQRGASLTLDTVDTEH